jgi:hypothetical protein
MHQMQVAGKSWPISANDLIDFAKVYDILDPIGRLQRICQAVSKWPSLAKQAGVPKAEITKISQFQPEWTKSFG